MVETPEIEKPSGSKSLADVQVENLSVPSSVRSLVYLIGTIGFPVLIAFYIVVSISGDIRSVDRRLEALTLQIDERPMSMERTSDFVAYVVDAMEVELSSVVLDAIDSWDLSFSNDEDRIYKVNAFKNDLQALIRPIVRKHQRFAGRFPSIGGNVGGYFTLEAPAETQEPGDTEAYLQGSTSKDFAESLVTVITNLLVNYGSFKDFEVPKSEIDPIEEMFRLVLGGDPADRVSEMEIGIPEAVSNLGDDEGDATTVDKAGILIDKQRLHQMTSAVISTMSVALRDQIILRARLNSVQSVK